MQKKILLNFNYQRIQWARLCEPFFDVAEIHWIRFISRDEDQTQKIINHHYHYWSDFNDAHEILELVNPDFIIVMDNRAPLTLALMFAAKNKNVITYYLQHGVYANYADYRILKKKLVINKSAIVDLEQVKSNVNFSTFQFLKRSLGSRLLNLRTFLFLVCSKIWDDLRAAYVFKDSLRIPDKYLCYSLENAIIHKEIDGVSENKFELVGNPELKRIISNYRNASSNNSVRYWLFVDQALSGSDIGESFILKDNHHHIYKIIAEKASINNCKLKVKLHPGSYTDKSLPNHPNIIWLKDVVDITSIIKGAEYCVGFFSSLLLPCIIYKPTLLVKVAELSFYQKMSKFKNVEVCNEELLSQWEANYVDVNTEQSNKIMNYFGSTSKLNYAQKLKQLVTSEC